METLKDWIRVLAIAIILVLLPNLKVEAAELKNNLNNLEGQITWKDFSIFIDNDKNYLNNLSENKNLDREIKDLEAELEKTMKEYETIEGIKVYKGNTGFKNSAIRTAIKNRKDYMKDGTFVYDDKTVYNIDRGYMGEKGNNRYFSQKDMDIAYESIVEVIENIELNKDFLDDTTMVVSPFMLNGMNGYTVSRSTNHSTIVICNNIFGANEEWKLISNKSTVLHEIGHVFQNSNKDEIEYSSAGRRYLIKTNKQLQEELAGKPSERQKWRASVNENFAEDFRIHFSKRLSKKSFKPLEKKTLLDYNEEEFTKVIKELDN